MPDMKNSRSQLFLGNDQISMAECYELHQVLEEAFEDLGMLQQYRPGDCSADSNFDIDDYEYDLEQCAVFIAKRLLGPDFEVVQKTGKKTYKVLGKRKSVVLKKKD